MAQNIYTIRDNSSGDTFKLSLDHRPTQGEIPGLIDAERLRQSQTTAKGTKQISQIQSELTEPGALERSWEFGKGELEGLGGLGKQFYTQAKQTLTGTQPKGTPFQIKLPNGKTSTVYNPYLNEGIPILPQLKSTYELARQNRFREAGKQFGSAVGQGALLAAPFTGPKPENIPEVIPPRQIRSGEIPTRLGTGGGEDFIEAEVLPNEPSTTTGTSEIKVTNPSLSTAEIGIKGQLGTGIPQVEAPTALKQLRPPSIKLGPSPLQESTFRKITPFSEQGQRQETLIPPSGQNTLITLPPPEFREKLASPSGEKPSLPPASGRRLTPQIRGKGGRSISVKPPKSIQTESLESPELTQNLTPEQQAFISKGGKITKLPSGKAEGAEELTGKVSGEETGFSTRNRLKRVKQTLKEIAGSEEGSINLDRIKKLLMPSGQISRARTQLMSPSRNLEIDPRTREFTQTAQRQELIGRAFGNTFINKYAKLVKGLNKSELNQLAQAIVNPQLEMTKNIRDLATQFHQMTDRFRQGANELYRGVGTPAETKITRPRQIGYQPNYLPEIKKVTLPQRVGQYLKDVNPFAGNESKRKTNIPVAPAMMHREGLIPKDELETELNKLMPNYFGTVSSASSRAPMVQLGNRLMSQLGEGEAKTNLADFLAQYSSHDDIFKAARGFNRLFSDLTNLSTRSILFANPRVQLLHAASLMTQVAPDLGGAETAKSIMEFTKSPAKYLRTVAKFQPPDRNWHSGLGAKFDIVSQLGNIGFRTAEAMAYPGYYKAAIGEGFKGAKAEAEAMRRVYKAFGVPLKGDDPLFLRHLGALPVIGPTTTRFARIPYNLIQNYISTLSSGDMWKIASSLMLGIAAYELDKKYRIPIFHLSVKNFEFTAEQTSRILSRLVTDLGKGNYKGANKQLEYLFKPASIRGYQREGIKGTLLEYERQGKQGRIRLPRVLSPSQVRFR